MHISFGKFTCAGVTLLITSELHWIAVVPVKTEYNVSNRSCFSCSLCMRCFLSIYNMCHPAPGFDVLAPESLIHEYLTQWRLSTLSKCIMYSVLGTEMQAESPNLCKTDPAYTEWLLLSTHWQVSPTVQVLLTSQKYLILPWHPWVHNTFYGKCLLYC